MEKVSGVLLRPEMRMSWIPMMGLLRTPFSLWKIKLLSKCGWPRGSGRPMIPLVRKYESHRRANTRGSSCGSDVNLIPRSLSTFSAHSRKPKRLEKVRSLITSNTNVCNQVPKLHMSSVCRNRLSIWGDQKIMFISR